MDNNNDGDEHHEVERILAKRDNDGVVSIYFHEIFISIRLIYLYSINIILIPLFQIYFSCNSEYDGVISGQDLTNGWMWPNWTVLPELTSFTTLNLMNSRGDTADRPR